MKNLIKFGVLIFLVLVQVNVYAQNKPKVLMGTSAIAPYTTEFLSQSRSSQEIQEGQYIEAVAKGIALSGKADVTVVAPMMSGIYNNMKKAEEAKEIKTIGPDSPTGTLGQLNKTLQN